MKKWILRLSLLLVLGAAGWGGYRLMKQFDTKEQTIPIATVRQGDVVIRSFTRGELRAVRSAMLNAPNLFGTVQITKLAPLGAFAREKDLIIEFDDSEVRSRLEEKQLDLSQVDEQLTKAQAELEIRNNQDQVDLLRSRYAVRRAQLEVNRNELLSAIDQKRNQLNLDEAQRRLKQLESDIKSRLEQSQAELAVLRERRNRAVLELNRERQRLGQVKLLAPMAGLVAVRQSRPMGFFMRGMQLPDLREGDQVFPGTPVADVMDVSELEVAAKVGELDRANLHENQDALIRLDAAPDKLFNGRIKSLSGTATANIWSGDPAKKFDVIFGVDMKELLTKLGAKPEYIRLMLEAAAKNRNKPAAPPQMSAMGMVRMGGGMPGGMAGGGGMQNAGFGGGMQGGGMQGGGQMGGMQGGASGEGGEGARQRGGREGGGQGRMTRFGGGDLTPEQQEKLRAEMQKIFSGRSPRDMSPEEQTKLRDQMAKAYEKITGKKMPERSAGAGAQRSAGEGGPRVGFSRPGGEAGGAPMMMPMMGGFGGQQFSEKDLESAQLPPPPEENSDLNVLLRPGLLADVEIIVEKVPNAIHVPVQAVFEKEGKPIVYVKSGNQYIERAIKPLKRSESVMVIAEGLKPGEMVALADPTATPGDKDKKAQKKATPSAGGSPAGGR
jgi:multidrug efflux pump subunit AcrA (membrane-fusion protein)